MESTLSMPAAEDAALALELVGCRGELSLRVDAVDILEASARCIKDEKESVDTAEEDIDMAATAESSAESAPWESTIVVIQEEFGSGGSLTLVIIPGTTSEK